MTWVVENQFREWLFKKLYDKKADDDYSNINDVFHVLFPDSDPRIMADMYWLLYQGMNTTNNEQVVNLFYEKPRPFFMTGHASSVVWVDDPNARLNNFRSFYNEQRQEAVNFFAKQYSDYFLVFWNIDQLLKFAKQKLKLRRLNKAQKEDLEVLVEILTMVKKRI